MTTSELEDLYRLVIDIEAVQGLFESNHLSDIENFPYEDVVINGLGVLSAEVVGNLRNSPSTMIVLGELVSEMLDNGESVNPSWFAAMQWVGSNRYPELWEYVKEVTLVRRPEEL